MRRNRLMLVLLALTGASVACAADKLPVPSDADQEPARTRIRALFKAEYAKVAPAALLALSDKLTAGAAEEKDRPAAQYVMLAEAVRLAVKGGDIERAVRAAREIDHDFDAPGLKELLASAFAEHIGAKDRLADYRTVAVAELAKPTDAQGQVDLGQKWQEVAKQVRTESRLTAVRRARQWLCEALPSHDHKGLARTEAEKMCQNATEEIEKADAQWQCLSGRLHAIPTAARRSFAPLGGSPELSPQFGRPYNFSKIEPPRRVFKGWEYYLAVQVAMVTTCLATAPLWLVFQVQVLAIEHIGGQPARVWCRSAFRQVANHRELKRSPPTDW